ncbi:MAG: vWA domain-containing protein [Planctomycetota bacterium]
MPAAHKRRTWMAISAGAVSVVALVAFLRSCGGIAEKPKSTDLLEALLRLRSQVEWPGLDVPSAAKELGTKEKAFAWVRDEVSYVGYRGAWGGAEGTLRTRIGNSTDKALLLRALLRELGYDARLARADFPQGEAPRPVEAKLPDFPALNEIRALIGPPSGRPAPDGGAAARAGRDEAAAALVKMRKALTELGVEGMDSAPNGAYLQEPAAPEVAWVWVQARLAGAPDAAWEDLDPVFPGRKRPEGVTQDWTPQPAMLAIEVEAADERGRVRPLARWQGAASDAIGHEISLMFLPGTCSPDRLAKLESPAQVGLWNTILQVGPAVDRKGAFTATGAVLTQKDGRVLLGDGAVLAPQEAGRPRPPVPLDRVVVGGVDASRWPRVRLQFGITSKERPSWHHEHINVRPPGGPRLPVRLESAQTDPRPLLLLLDVSGSMTEDDGGRRMVLAREALRRLVEALNPEQEVGLMTFSGAAWCRMRVPIAPLKGQREALLQEIAGVGSEGIGTGIYYAVDRAANSCTRPSVILLVTDGADTSDSGAQGRQAAAKPVRDAGHSLVSVGIGGADPVAMRDLARRVENAYIEVQKLDSLVEILGAIGNDLSGGLGVSFEAPPGAKPGDRVKLAVIVAGYAQPLEVEVTVPAESAPAGAATSRIVLRVEMQGGGLDKPRRFQRTLQDLSPGFDRWELISHRRIGFSVAPPTARVRLAREVDELIETIRTRLWAAGGPKPVEFAAARGVSSRTCRLQHDLFHGLAASLPEDLKLAWTGPAVFLETSQVRGEGGEAAALRETLDVLASCLGPPDSATGAQHALFGLTLPAVEAAILGGKSANVEMLQAPSLSTALSSEGVPPGFEDWFAAGWCVAITPPGPPGTAWLYPRSGELRTILRPARAKGASVEKIAADFKRIRSVLKLYGALGSGVLSGIASPNSALFSALCNFFDEQMKLWCYSSVMLGLVAEGIEAGDFDAEKSSAYARKLCEIKGDMNDYWKNVVGAWGAGWVGGKWEDKMTEGATILFGDTWGVRFLFGAGTSYFNPISDKGTDLVIDALNSKYMPSVAPSR